MSQIAKVTEISARSPESFQAAIEDALERANDTLRNVSSAWVKEQHVHVRDGNIADYQVNLLVTFVLD